MQSGGSSDTMGAESCESETTSFGTVSMSDDERTRFRFECEGIEVELAGDDAFVERMYRRLMRDIDAARGPDAPDASDPGEAEPAPDDPREGHVVWLIRCDDMMRRVYMIDPMHFRDSILDRCLDDGGIDSLYIERDTMKEFLPDIVDQHRTLWAELTETGHDKIADSDDS